MEVRGGSSMATPRGREKVMVTVAAAAAGGVESEFVTGDDGMGVFEIMWKDGGDVFVARPRPTAAVSLTS